MLSSVYVPVSHCEDPPCRYDCKIVPGKAPFVEVEGLVLKAVGAV